jgi:HAE1 family hydrophobic/amphiphilic exporter-1
MAGKWPQVFIEDRARIPVKLMSTTNPINDPTDLESIYLKAGDGRIVPMSTIATLTEKAVAPDLRRESQMRSVSITAGLDPRHLPWVTPGARRWIMSEP